MWAWFTGLYMIATIHSWYKKLKWVKEGKVSLSWIKEKISSWFSR